ncbi:LacI family DNA-binding transcriptional regulator [Brevundimonas nasdae]|uniref:LacI family DNA-binding transcriptional regulator n=1 Tax=Brevundimonas nasdae TaxID=172043 RepID=UPI003F692717
MTRTRRAQVTLADVARVSRVSIMTVSNVLNGGGRASDDTRMRVREAAASLGYVPNLSASRLAGAGLSRVGVIYNSGESAFQTTLTAAIATEAASRGLQLLFRPLLTRKPERVRDLAQELVSSGAEAIILVPPYAEMLDVGAMTELGVPLAGLVTASPIEGMATARIDNVGAAQAVTTLLLDQGHERIGVVVGPLNHSDSIARRDGHRAALIARGLTPPDELEAQGDFGFASGIACADQLLDLEHPPTAIVAANDEMAAGVLWTANRRALRLPDDLAVCGFDDTLLATRVWPTLTTIRQPLAEMAGQAMEALKTAFRNRSDAPAATDAVLPFTLIQRGSTKPKVQP